MYTAQNRYFYNQNRLKQLRAFCHVAQAGSITRAAELMFLSQPSISLLVQALEKNLGADLLVRNGPRIKLSDKGKLLYELALPLVEGLESLPTSFAESCKDPISGVLKIAASESVILYIMPDFIKKFGQSFPYIRIEISNVTGRDGLAMLRSGEVDFSIASMLELHDDIIYFPCWSFEPMLITPVDHPLTKIKPVTLEKIAEYGLIMPPKHLTTWRVIETVFQQNNINYSVTLEAGGWEVIKKYVAMGHGISITSDICLSDNTNLVKIPLNKYFPRRNYGLVIRKGKFISPAIRHFFSMIDKNALKRIKLLQSSEVHQNGMVCA